MQIRLEIENGSWILHVLEPGKTYIAKLPGTSWTAEYKSRDEANAAAKLYFPFHKVVDFTFDNILEVEDSLQEAKVFINPRTRQTCHSDSYGTCVDFPPLEKWTKERKFGPELLEYCCGYWNRNVNIGPPLKIAASMIAHWGGLK